MLQASHKVPVSLYITSLPLLLISVPVPYRSVSLSCHSTLLMSWGHHGDQSVREDCNKVHVPLSALQIKIHTRDFSEQVLIGKSDHLSQMWLSE